MTQMLCWLIFVMFLILSLSLFVRGETCPLFLVDRFHPKWGGATLVIAA
jgi:hypothetical protein